MPTSRPAPAAELSPAEATADDAVLAAQPELAAGHALAAVLTSLVGATEITPVEHALVQGARWLTGARSAVLAVRAEGGPARVLQTDASVTASPAGLPGADCPVVESREPLPAPEPGGTYAVPVLAGGRAYAVLSVLGAPGPDGFTAADADLLGVLAVAGGKAIRAAQANEATRGRAVSTASAVLVALERERREAVAEERERLAQLLHDGAMQRVFAAGLRLQTAGPAGPDPDDIAAIVHELDQTVREVRSMIAALRGPAVDYLTGP